MCHPNVSTFYKRNTRTVMVIKTCNCPPPSRRPTTLPIQPSNCTAPSKRPSAPPFQTTNRNPLPDVQLHSPSRRPTAPPFQTSNCTPVPDVQLHPLSDAQMLPPLRSRIICQFYSWLCNQSYHRFSSKCKQSLSLLFWHWKFRERDRCSMSPRHVLSISLRGIF